MRAVIQTIKHWDEALLYTINQRGQNQLFDAVLPWLRESSFWLPLYLFFIAFVFVNFTKRGIFWVFFFVLTIVICDQFSSTLIKSYFGRLRPCNDPFVLHYIKLRLSGCPGGFSFTSSHATNHFGIATFVHLSLGKYLHYHTKWLFAWAAAVCYAQMYVGVHYPTDILGGAVAGLLAGWLSFAIFHKYIQLETTANPSIKTA